MTDAIYHLVIQAPTLEATQAEPIAALACAQGVLRLNATAMRLLNVAHDEATQQQVRHWCAQQRLDFAFVPAGQRLSRCRLLAMDMDSTLINIECIDEIAALAGRGAEIKAITDAAMRGEIRDFSDSLHQRVALLADVPLALLEQVYTERLRLNTGAERLLTCAHSAGLATLLLSGGFTFFTDKLQTQLGFNAAYANTLEIHNGRLTGKVQGPILDGAAKARHLQSLAMQLHAQPHEIIAIGDGANDLPMLALAGFSVAWRGKPIVRQHATYTLDYVGLDGVLNWFEDI